MTTSKITWTITKEGREFICYFFSEIVSPIDHIFSFNVKSCKTKKKKKKKEVTRNVLFVQFGLLFRP